MTDPRARTARTRTRWGLGNATLLVVLVVLVVAGPFLAPLDPTASISTPFAAPGPAFPLGTDNLGRDVLSRLLAGGMPVLVLPTVAVAISTLLGATVGLALAAGPRRGRRSVAVLDLFLMLPPVLLLLILAFALGPGAGTLIVIVVVLAAPFTARQVRAVADPLWDAGYVDVALTAGRGRAEIALREILPNLRGPILADAGTRLVGAVYVVASASFLGVSPLPGALDWASMVADSLGGVALNPIAVLAPALAIIGFTVPVNLLADRWTR